MDSGCGQTSVLEIWLNWRIHLGFTMLTHHVFFQFRMLNIYHPSGFHLMERAWSQHVTNQLFMYAWKFRTSQSKFLLMSQFSCMSPRSLLKCFLWEMFVQVNYSNPAPPSSSTLPITHCLKFTPQVKVKPKLWNLYLPALVVLSCFTS
jgi:hypothetical protein